MPRSATEYEFAGSVGQAKIEWPFCSLESCVNLDQVPESVLAGDRVIRCSP